MPSLRGIPYSFHYEFEILEESPCPLTFLKFHEERDYSHPIDVIPIQNVFEQEIKLYSSLLQEKMSPHRQFHKFQCISVAINLALNLSTNPSTLYFTIKYPFAPYSLSIPWFVNDPPYWVLSNASHLLPSPMLSFFLVHSSPLMAWV